VVNNYLVEYLQKLGLWDLEMLDQLKYNDGNLGRIEGVPEELKERYKEAFDIDPRRAIELTARRGRWIDQSQSHNVFMKGTSGRLLSEIYLTAWKLGLKTTYYLRTLAATQIEKSTLDATKYGYTQKREYLPMAATPGQGNRKSRPEPVTSLHGGNGTGNAPPRSLMPKRPEPSLCRIDDPDCEACQ
jgi:ribonucleoside-diphosphate reductase alpha chain